MGPWLGMLDWTTWVLFILGMGSAFRLFTYYHEQKQVKQLRKDIRFIYVMTRVWALEGDWPAHCKAKLLEEMAKEDTPLEEDE